MSMETKMAGSLKNVQNLITELLSSSRPAQETELQKLAEFAVANGFQHNFEMYDIPYWRFKQLQSIVSFRRRRDPRIFPDQQCLKRIVRAKRKSVPDKNRRTFGFCLA
ncbi:hypothetical protein HA402_008740 [Bradysia odoriphaga]|nr:hypothetical protein HA402_008740 [Bradysia odoriphaga]